MGLFNKLTKGITYAPITNPPKVRKPTVPRSPLIPSVDFKLPITETARGICTSKRYIPTTFVFTTHRSNIRLVEYLISDNEMLTQLFSNITEKDYTNCKVHDDNVVIEFVAIQIRITILEKNTRRVTISVKESTQWQIIYQKTQ